MARDWVNAVSKYLPEPSWKKKKQVDQNPPAAPGPKKSAIMSTYRKAKSMFGK